MSTNSKRFYILVCTCDKCEKMYELYALDCLEPKRPCLCAECYLTEDCGKNTKKLCGNMKCKRCFDRSFASHPKAKYWDYEKNKKSPREVFKSAISKAFFKCEDCLHGFEIKLNSVSNDKWCCYCSSCVLCSNSNCTFCHEKSFASHPKAKYWDYEKNKKSPREVFKNSAQKAFFKCGYCLHGFESVIHRVSNGNRCGYCYGDKLCTDLACTFCFNRSFASHPKAKYWDYEKNKKSPREIRKGSMSIAFFKCEDCLHGFKSSVCSVYQGYWCSYCFSKKLCSDSDCTFCHEKSFASHPKAKYWDYEKNIGLTPRDVFKCSDKKIWFKCSENNHNFQSIICNVSRRNSWCPHCNYKTENKLYNWLLEKFPLYNITRQVKFDWGKNPKTNKALPYDFFIIRDDKSPILLELDGAQHFRQVSNWDSCKVIQHRDIIKQSLANNNGYTVIRICQEKVLYGTGWEELLYNTLLEDYKEPRLIFIADDGKYAYHV